MKRNPDRFSQRDANHEEVKGWYEALHCSVFDAHSVGWGFPDLVVGCSGVTALVEVKSEHGTERPSQARFRLEWRGAKVVTVRTREEVIAHVQAIRGRYKAGMSV